MVYFFGGLNIQIPLYLSNVITHAHTHTIYIDVFYNCDMQGGSGTASNIKFQNIDMHDVTNPIIIDQNYCDQDKPCKEQVIK